MPVVEFDYVISFSSQDDRFPVHNLLKNNDLKKTSWLSSEKDHSGVLRADLQLKKASVISHVDIGNHGSAIVELLVGRSCSRSDKYVTLLPAVVFMSCLQSSRANYTNSCSSVRMFTKDDFAEDARNENWDRIRIVCQQPFRNDVQFGLSFLILKGTGGVTVAKQSIPNVVDEFRRHFVRQSTSEQTSSRNNSEESRSRKMLDMSRRRSHELLASKRKRPSRELESLGGLDEVAIESDRPHRTKFSKRLSEPPAGLSSSKDDQQSVAHECPICSGRFPVESIQDHVEVCLSREPAVDIVDLTRHEGLLQCPLCGVDFEMSEIESHASNCSLN